MSFGTPNYNGNKGFKKKNHFDTSDGDVIARILPPFGSLSETGTWHVFHAVHFGYKNSEGKHRPFVSPLKETYDKETKTRTVKVADPALDRLNELKAKLEKAQAEGNTALAAKLETLVGFKGVFNIDKNQHFNVMLLDGKAGELKIRHKMFLALKEKVDKLRAEGVDPLSLDNGRFFVFHKSGKGRDTTVEVTVYKEKVDVPGLGTVEKEAVSKIDGETAARLTTELFDLDTLFPTPTAEEVAQIVAESDLTGKSPACDRIFDAKWKAKRKNNEMEDPRDSDPKLTKTPPTPQAAQTSNPPAAAQKEALTSTTPPTGKQGSLSQTTQAKPQAQAIAEMSDEQFWAECGINPNDIPGKTG